MKMILITVTLIAMTAAELLPSKSYLPPPSGGSSGYPRGSPSNLNAAPEIVAARSLEGQSQEANGFTRSSVQDQSHARFGHADVSRDQKLGSFGGNGDGDDDSVSFEADVSGFKAHASYHDEEGRSGYGANSRSVHSGNHGNGLASTRGKNGARSGGY